MMQGEEGDALTSYMKHRVGSNETPEDFFGLRTLPDICGHFV